MAKRRRTLLRLLIWTLLGLAALLAGSYGYLTNPNRLRAKALKALHALQVEGLDVAQVTFSLRDGLQISDLVIRPTKPLAGSHNAPPTLHVAHARIACNLAGLLRGRLEPTKIDVDQATVTIICDPAQYEDTPQAASFDTGVRRLWAALHEWRERLPPVRIAQTDLHLMIREHGRPQLIERSLLRVVGEPTAAGYHVRIDRLPAKDEPLAAAQWGDSTRDLKITLDWARLRTVQRLLPASVAEKLAPLKLAGRARVDRLIFRAAGPPNEVVSNRQNSEPAFQLALAEVRLADLSGVIPLEDHRAQATWERGNVGTWERENVGTWERGNVGTWERGVIPLEDEHTQATVEPFLQVTNASVKVIYGRTKSDPTLRLEVSAAGQLNGAPLRLSFSAEPELPAGLWAPPDGVKGSASSASGFGLDAVRAADLFIAGLELPTAQSHPALLHSARLPGALAEAFEHYQPRGKINLRLRILPLETRGADSEPLSGVARITGELEALGATCRYYEFPYEFEDARGRVRFSQGRILLENLRGRHGFGRACVNGEVFSSSSWTGFDLRFRGENIALNADLYAALPERYRPLWQSAALLGMSDVAVHISRPDGTAQAGAPSADINVDAHLLDGSLTLGDGRRLSHANGRLTIKGGTIHIHDLHGYDKETSVRLSGRIRATPDGPDTDLHVEVVDLPLEEQATLSRDPLGVTPADMTEPAKQSSIVNRQSSVRFEGRADAWGRVHGTGTAAGRQQHFAVHIKDGELHALDPERSWTESAGWVIVRDDRQQIVSFTCCQDDAWFDAAGMVPNAAQPGTPLTLDLHARGQALERLLPQFVPRDWADLTESLGLTGAGDVLVLLRPTAAGAAAGQGADIHLRADRMQAEPLPLGLRDVTAHVTLAPGNFELRSADASWGTDGKIQAQGDGSWQTDEVEVDLSVTARGMKFCPEFNEALPDSVARLIETIALQGEFDALLDRVQISGGAQRAWHFRGHLPLRAAALHLGLELTELDGELSGECTIDPAGEVTLNTEFAIRRAKLAGRPIEHWTGQLLHAAGERWVRLDDLGGRLCDGDALCSVWIDPKTSEYELSLTLKDVSVNELFPPPNDRPECKRHGRLSGTVYLRGRGGDAGTRRGGGDLRLSGASFLHTPVLSSVSQAGTEGKRPINDTVERADLRFLWEGALIRLSRVDIQSRDLRLVGEGTWNLRDDTIRMTLVGAHPEHWPRLLLISDLVELAGQELVQYHVEGPLDSPKVTAEPLYKLNEAIRALLTGGQE